MGILGVDEWGLLMLDILHGYYTFLMRYPSNGIILICR